MDNKIPRHGDSISLYVCLKILAHIPQECWWRDDIKAFYDKNMSPSSSSGQLAIPCEFYLYSTCDPCDLSAPGDFISPKKMSEKMPEGALQLAARTLYTSFFLSEILH